MKRCITIILSLFICCTTKANEHDSTITAVLERIASMQATQDEFFIPGIFPSYISNRAEYSERKNDNNVFFTALIAYTLKDLRPKLSEENKIIVDSILQRSRPVYQKFKNKKGRNTYNFWRRDSAQVFPYSRLLGKINKDYDLPDDLDDTVLSLMALDVDSAEAEQVHQLMQQFINSPEKPVRSVYKDYEKYPAYSVWFGKNFPTVFDVCVLSNILTFVERYDLKWTKADSASLDLIIAAIKNNDHFSAPMYVSPYYGNTSIILYHLSRLMAAGNIPGLEAMKYKLIGDVTEQLSRTNNVLERIMLSNVLMKWTIDVASIQNVQLDEIERNDLPFFIGNIPAYFHEGSRVLFTENDWLMFYHYCPAYNDALYLEYLVL